jgi:sugar phosphate isomerase/epimerase
MNLTRREFLLRTTAGAATAAMLPDLVVPTWAAEDKWSMRLSTSTVQFSSLPIEEAFERISRLGFQGVDIWSAYEGCPHLDDANKRLGPTGLKDLLAKNKLQLCSFSTYVGGYARYAELLGGVGGGVAIQGSAGPCAPNELTAKMRQFLDSLKPLVELAEKHNSKLAIENHGSALLDGPDSFKAFVDLNRSDRVGIALAPYHVQASRASVEEVIAICGPQLLFFYAWQNAPGTEQLPGHGPVDFTLWLKALAKVKYQGYVNPFMHGHPAADAMSAALAKSREYLQRIYANSGL